MSRAEASKGKKKGGVSFTIDCSKPVDDKIMEIASLISFREIFFHSSSLRCLIDFLFRFIVRYLQGDRIVEVDILLLIVAEYSFWSSHVSSNYAVVYI
ncbi:hypothetical protein HID58_058900 [Brassica napus]|uniref:Uncharacterized protein n=1 Tax=Brassica napus TaxID=3708 RepID=A0ABQ7ZRG6_BRANA|nr:hypothetical protein HID58_058900 [Brassica napus]